MPMTTALDSHPLKLWMVHPLTPGASGQNLAFRRRCSSLDVADVVNVVAIALQHANGREALVV